MAHFLIEVPHAEDKVACLRAIEIFVATGSHFLANAEWGCEDGEHKAWLIVDMESREQAQQVIPSFYRDRAKITKLFKVTKEDVESYRKEHKMSDREPLHN
jgi:hypothetical protein